jgi:hypothetical protein
MGAPSTASITARSRKNFIERLPADESSRDERSNKRAKVARPREPRATRGAIRPPREDRAVDADAGPA